MIQAEVAYNAHDWRTLAHLLCQARHAPNAPSFDAPPWQRHEQAHRWDTL
jgi:hypothetical protein